MKASPSHVIVGVKQNCFALRLKYGKLGLSNDAKDFSMKKLFFEIFAALLVFTAASCKTKEDKPSDNESELAAADALQGITAADRADFNKNLQPLPENEGWKSTCDGCMLYWAGQEDPRKTDQPIYDWNALQRKCLQKGQCKNVFENTQAWSSIRVLHDLVRIGPMKRWAEYRSAKKKVVCLYEHAYHAGAEVCYEGPGRAVLPEKMKGKVSSYQIENIEKFYATGPGLKRYESFGNDGYNLLPEYNDKMTEIVILNR